MPDERKREVWRQTYNDLRRWRAPDDLVSLVQQHGIEAVAAREQVSVSTVKRHLLATAGYVPKLRRPVPEDWAQTAPFHTYKVLARLYGAGVKLLKRWVAESGVAPRVKVRPKSRVRVLKICTFCDAREFAPVYWSKLVGGLRVWVEPDTKGGRVCESCARKAIEEALR